MGNQNRIQQHIKTIRETDQVEIINLDDIVKQWIWSKCNKMKSKSLSRFKREDLLININWKQVSFVQKNVNYHHSSYSCSPRTIFRTNFDNKTQSEHSYTFATNQSTRSIFKYMHTRSLYKSHESNLIFHLPEHIVDKNNSMKREQSIPFGQDIIKDYEKNWNVNSEIRVPYQTRIIAELNIDEEEFHSNFSISIQFSGRVTVSIATRQSPNSYLKYIHGDIVKIIYQTMKSNPQLKVFQIVQGKSPLVCFIIHGKCSFRYGVKQNIVLNQELLDLSPTFNFTKPSAPMQSAD